MVKNGKVLKTFIIVFSLCFAIASLIACVNAGSSDVTSVPSDETEQISSSSEEQSTESSSEEQSTESSSEEQSTESSSDSSTEQVEEEQSSQTVNPPSNPVEESTYTAH